MKMSKKITLFFTIIMLFFGTTFSVPKAHAQTVDVQQFLKEFGIDTLTTILQTRILDKMVDDTLNWANGGFDGEPGFLNNWDGFLKGISTDVYTNALSYAGSAANQAFTNSSAGNIGNSSGYTPESLEARNLCREPLEQQSLQLLDQQAQLDGTDIAGWETIEEQLDELEQQIEDCEDLLVPISSNPGSVAQANYETYSSGELNPTRNAFEIVTNFASKELDVESGLDNLLEGKGGGLATLLGSEGKVDDYFAGNMGIPNWEIYAEGGNLINTYAGKEALIEGELKAKKTREENSILADLATPQKYLNKTICEEYKKDPEGNDTGECLRETTQTPGAQIASKVNLGLNKEEERSQLAKELSDVLAAAVGKIADGLLQAGLNALGGAISNQGGAALAEITEGNIFENITQNEYDILGITPIENTEGTSGTTPAVSPGTGSENTIDLNTTSLETDSSIPDIAELESILDIETELEKSYLQTKEFLNIKEKIVIETKKVEQPVMDLDRCVPGPDFGWEKRYTDLIDIEGIGYGGKFEDEDEDDDEEFGDDKWTSPGPNAERNKLAFNLLKAMTKDPQINIPGATEMIALSHSYLRGGNDGINAIKNSMESKREAFVIVTQLRSLVEEDYNAFKDEIKATDTANSDSLWDKFPLFESEWEKLSAADKIAVLSIQDESGSYLLEKGAGSTAMILNEINGLTPAEYLEKDINKAKNVVLSYAWEGIWKKGMMNKPAEITSTGEMGLSGQEQRNNILRYFFSIRNDLATNQDIINTNLEMNTVIANNLRVANYLNDCQRFRIFMYGPTEIPPLKQTSKEMEPGDFWVSLVSGYANLLENGINSSDQTNNEFYSKDIDIFVGNVPEKSRETILNFLEQERLKQNDNNNATQSVFKTDIITSPGNIEMSILGKTESEINQYYQANYGTKPNQTLEGHTTNYLKSTGPANTVAKILSRDFVIAEGGRKAREIKGRTGALFCWSEGDYSLHKKGHADKANGKDVVSECLKPWYYTKDIEYKIIFSDIQ